MDNSRNELRSVCIDVDGVLAQYDGWKGVENIGDPFPGAADWVSQIHEHYRVIIYTTRVNVEVNIDYTEVTLIDILKGWLDKHGFLYDDIKPKVKAVAYIDDRAIVCTPKRSFKAWDYYASASSRLQQLHQGSIFRYVPGDKIPLEAKDDTELPRHAG
jgi:hypothetical protein